MILGYFEAILDGFEEVLGGCEVVLGGFDVVFSSELYGGLGTDFVGAKRLRFRRPLYSVSMAMVWSDSDIAYLLRIYHYYFTLNQPEGLFIKLLDVIFDHEVTR